MNSIDIKTEIKSKYFKILERIDGRIIFYNENNNPIASFDDLEHLVSELL